MTVRVGNNRGQRSEGSEQTRLQSTMRRDVVEHHSIGRVWEAIHGRIELDKAHEALDGHMEEREAKGRSTLRDDLDLLAAVQGLNRHGRSQDLRYA